jgi:lysozyme family protein
MNRFDECVNVVIGFEGGYVNDKDDKGGETNYGITASTLKSAKAKGWVPSNVTIRSLKLDHAKTIYKKGYWDVVKADNLPHPLDLIVFDMAVNHGPNTAVKLFQQSLNSILKSGPSLVVDGIIGPKTLTAVRDVVSMDHNPWLQPNALVRYLCIDVLVNRVELYTSIIASNKSQEKFFKGWITNRVVKLKQQAGL